MFNFGQGFGRNAVDGAISQIREKAGGFIDFFGTAWDGLSPEDQELLKQGAISGLKLLAKALIASDKGGKVTF